MFKNKEVQFPNKLEINTNTKIIWCLEMIRAPGGNCLLCQVGNPQPLASNTKYTL